MKLREEEFYEQYHQHGGTTIIPTEIFNELYDDATEEIERLNNDIKELRELLEYKNDEIERLNSIIKEVREYIGIDEELRKVCSIYDVNGIRILEILDKENNNVKD